MYHYYTDMKQFYKYVSILYCPDVKKNAPLFYIKRRGILDKTTKRFHLAILMNQKASLRLPLVAIRYTPKSMSGTLRS